MDTRSAREGKPEKKRRRGTRYANHTCWHHDWWSGTLGMPPDQVGVYERIIKLMYIRRAALKDDDRELAQLFHCELRIYRRIKAALLARGRIVQDEENGLLYDERTIRELVDAGFFSEEQTARAMRRHGKTPVLTVVDERARSDATNVVPISQAQAVSVAQVLHKVGAKSETKLSQVGPQNEEDQPTSVESVHANQYPITNSKPNAGAQTAPRRSPLDRGGAGPVHGMDVEQWRADQLQRMGLIAKGKDDGAGATAQPEPKPPADRKARRA